MLNPGDVLKFVIYRFNQSPFAEHDFVENRHQRVPHVVAEGVFHVVNILRGGSVPDCIQLNYKGVAGH